MAMQNPINLLELTRLLHDLKDRRPDIGVRFRLMGEMWHTNHFRIVELTESGATVLQEPNGRMLVLDDLSRVMQFELDERFQQYEPHYHYTIDPAFVNS